MNERKFNTFWHNMNRYYDVYVYDPSVRNKRKCRRRYMLECRLKGGQDA